MKIFNSFASESRRGAIHFFSFRSVSCFIIYRNFAKYFSVDNAVKNAHACRISTPRQGASVSDNGVGVDCLLLNGRLAMPR